MKSMISCLAVMMMIYAPASQAADCGTAQQYFNEWGAAQAAVNGYDYQGKTNAAQEQFERCKAWAWHDSGGDNQVAEKIRECEESYNLEISNIEMEYWPLHDNLMMTEIIYQSYMYQVYAEGLQCF